MTTEPAGEFESSLINDQLKVAVLMGGVGGERAVSMRSGNCVAAALEAAGLKVLAADIDPENLGILEDDEIDVFFVALHGEFGEDGQLQQILEEKSLVYTGSGPAASRLAFDKLAAKARFIEAGITMPKSIGFDINLDPEDIKRELAGFGQRYVVKPTRQGSTIGVTIAESCEEALAAARDCSEQFGQCMIEEFIGGREITVGILENEALPIIEIHSKSGFYDYEAKYVDEQTEFLFDTISDSGLVEKINASALDCFNSLGCRHFARVDFVVSEEGVPYALEVNNIPGFTDRSDLPKAAAKVGLSLSDLCVRIIEAALRDGRNAAEVNQTIKNR